MAKKILIACFEVPGHGGASTSAYNLFHYMVEDGVDVSYINIISAEDQAYYNYVFGDSYGNPRSLDNVFNCVISDRLFSNEPHKEIMDILLQIKPDIILGVNYIAALLFKIAAPKVPLIYYCSGVRQVQDMLDTGEIDNTTGFIKKIEKKPNIPKIIDIREQEAVKRADLILAHSNDVLTLLQHFYRYHLGKIYDEVIWKAEWIYQDALGHSALSKPFNKRDIDIIFIASVWSRVQKNYPMLKKILPGLKKHKIHVVGEVEKEFDFVNYEGLVTDRYELFSLMGNSKVIVCPSSFDPAPGILFEASALECNIVASKNCGNWQLCNKNLLVETYSPDGFTNNISKAVKRKYNDNINYFLKTNSYKNLVDIISVF